MSQNLLESRLKSTDETYRRGITQNLLIINKAVEIMGDMYQSLQCENYIRSQSEGMSSEKKALQKRIAARKLVSVQLLHEVPEKQQVRNQSYMTMLVSQGVTESNLLEILAIVEQTAYKIILDFLRIKPASKDKSERQIQGKADSVPHISTNTTQITSNAPLVNLSTIHQHLASLSLTSTRSIAGPSTPIEMNMDETDEEDVKPLRSEMIRKWARNSS